MIEGLRILPHLDAAKWGPANSAVDLLVAKSCGPCMKRHDPNTRRAMGCGYEEPHPNPVPWSPLSLRGAPLKHCPGYTTKLPEVVEASWAHDWRNKGALAQWSDKPITDNTRESIAILVSSIADLEAHQLEEQRKKAARR